jgi:hypothetical protein
LVFAGYACSCGWRTRDVALDIFPCSIVFRKRRLQLSNIALKGEMKSIRAHSQKEQLLHQAIPLRLVISSGGLRLAPYLIASSFTTRPISSRAVWHVKWECFHTLECRCAYLNGSDSGPYRHVPMLVVRYLTTYSETRSSSCLP